MFEKNIYENRRKNLKEEIQSGGILLFPGNTESAMNYAANTYHYRQDSSFLYFFGLDHSNLAAIIDLDENKEIIFGDDLTIDDVIWMGDQPTMEERAAKAGVKDTQAFKELYGYIRSALENGRKIHILPPYRGDHYIFLARVLNVHFNEVDQYISEDFIKSVVALREIKDEHEIQQIEMAVDTAYKMHTTVMRMAFPGVWEREIAGMIEGIALANGGPVSFPVILSMNGQTLHNHYHGNLLKEDRMIVTDAGAETSMHYASDITRTVPVGGKFDPEQKEIYEIVLKANMECIKKAAPGVKNKDLHLHAAEIIATGLKEAGLMKGDINEAVSQGAHAMFFPHGLGHMMGLDVHDMENLGEKYVGYDDNTERSKQFGLAALRLGKELKPGFVITIEPGIYFIPHLIDLWEKEGKFTEFINYDKLEKYKNFGGIRIEDDVLITDTGQKVLGKPVPKTIEEIERYMKG